MINATMRRYAILASLLILSLLACAPREFTVPEDSLRVGDTAPPFTLADGRGNLHNLADLYAEKPLLLVFFSADCPPCRLEMKRLNGFRNLREGDGNEMPFNIAVVTNSSREEIKRVEGKDGPIRFTVLYDEDFTVLRDYRIFAFPYNFLIDTDGSILMIEIGYNGDIIDKVKRRLDNIPEKNA